MKLNTKMMAVSIVAGLPMCASALEITNLGGNVVDQGPVGLTPIVQNVMPAYGARSQWIRPVSTTGFEYSQTWLAPQDFSIKGYAVQLSNVQNAIANAASATIRATVYEYASASDATPVATLTTETGVTAADFGAATTNEYHNWIYFEFGTPVAVEAGKTYGIYLEWEEPNDTRNLSLHHSTTGTSPYPDGVMWRTPDGGVTWNGYASGVDMAFAVVPVDTVVSALEITNLGGNVVNQGPAGLTPIVQNIMPAYGARSQWIRPVSTAGLEYSQTWMAPQDFSIKGYAVQLSNLQDTIRDAGSATIRATVYKYASAADTTPVATLKTATGVTAADFGAAATNEFYNWIYFEFGTPVAVEAGKIYGIYLEWEDPNDTRNLSLHHSVNGTSPYADGVMWRTPDGGATWSGYASGVDMAFAVVPVATVVSGYASWASAFSDPALSNTDSTADPDNDGFINAIEYALGIDPRFSSASPGVITNNGMTITFTKGAEAKNDDMLTYEIETSISLGAEDSTPWAVNVADVTDGPDTISITFPPGPVKNFARLKISFAP